MKSKFNFKKLVSVLAALFLIFNVISCQRDEDVAADDLPQEELTKITLNVKDIAAGTNKEYSYIIGSGAPVIPVTDGKSYEVTTTFWNGSDDVTKEIKDAKDEHFLIFDFPKSTVNLTRLDDKTSTGKLGKVGLKTKWDVVKAVGSSSPLLKLTLIHDPASANESQNGTAWGSVSGGETDAEATFGLTN
ncbi:hypothetical protein [Epilithonimonas sp.]|uniref:hypothetical protein n=1 Tax=Epilithonimonas sp. TaxID=2894511 RepID=UPI0028A58FAE|nr:hypothetical protein [Epilithonimonas sp.]